ncbi:RNA 2',3'-cyclic phosphodiesterase [Halobacillus sp. Marseille-P3879]|uniref:RNA 2',3'-cyclic phosphodiesterase n=1 Tax=Halobacillus sp. Marseille-P3879 TaxID=2045014 RepID=UPI000C7BDF8F|nr:RNA 2',3'-cyclic phosphodiesterase [Halobacillus sp. Marseille-P3879]
MSKHYFIGIPVTEKVKKMCMEMQRELADRMDYKVWTHPDDLHITLKFLGGCSPDQVRKWQEELSGLSLPERFSLDIGPANGFGDRKHPRVFFVDTEAHSSLIHLKETIDRTGEKLGFPREKRSYSPHVTLAKKWKEGQSPLGEGETIFLNHLDMEVEQFYLYKIHPGENPKYEKTTEFKLQGD